MELLGIRRGSIVGMPDLFRSNNVFFFGFLHDEHIMHISIRPFTLIGRRRQDRQERGVAMRIRIATSFPGWTLLQSGQQLWGPMVGSHASREMLQKSTHCGPRLIEFARGPLVEKGAHVEGHNQDPLPTDVTNTQRLLHGSLVRPSNTHGISKTCELRSGLTETAGPGGSISGQGSFQLS